MGGWPKQEDCHELKAGVGYIVRTILKKKRGEGGRGERGGGEEREGGKGGGEEGEGKGGEREEGKEEEEIRI